MKNRLSSLVFFLLILTHCPVHAHHANAPHYDNTKPLNLKGVVTEFKLVNPHAWVYLDVTNADGSVDNWRCEMGPATNFRRMGWNDSTFAIGENVQIEGIAARRDPFGCSFRGAVLSDGSTVARLGEIAKGAEILTQSEVVINTEVDLNSMAGTWITTLRGEGGGGGGPRGGDPVEVHGDLLTEAGKAAVSDYDARFDDPALECRAASIIRAWASPDMASELLLSEDQIIFRHEFMDTVRTIDLTTRNHPDKIELSMTGHSVGWFEGDVLIVETVGFEAGVLTPHPGLMHSENMKVIERFSLAEGGTRLLRAYEVIDPDYLSRPFTGNNSWTRSDISVSPYNCTELSSMNNID